VQSRWTTLGPEETVRSWKRHEDIFRNALVGDVLHGPNAGIRLKAKREATQQCATSSGT